MGVYSSPIENPNKRFFTMLGTLVQGRVCISGASISAAKTALTIAIRYGLRRRQFGPADGDEVPILDYRTHQRRLMPLLAKTYALHFAQAELAQKFDHVMRQQDPPDRERRELESLAAGDEGDRQLARDRTRSRPAASAAAAPATWPSTGSPR